MPQDAKQPSVTSGLGDPALATEGPEVDYRELARDGYTTIRGAVPDQSIEEFHATINELGVALCERHHLQRRHDEPLLDVLLRGGSYRTQLFLMLKYLHVVQRMSLDLVERLRRGGLWRELGMRVPVAWPTLRADPPDEDTYLLPMHQDIATTRCHVALRGWIPLTPANEECGTIRVVPGSHALGYLTHELSEHSRPSVPASRYEHLMSQPLTCAPGDLVLFHPGVIHGSVPNRGTSVKLTLLVQMQDLATMADPDDPHDPMHAWFESMRTTENVPRRDAGG